MSAWQIALITIATIIVAISALIITLWYVVLPRFLVKKLRSGQDVTDNPNDYEQIQQSVSVDKNRHYASTLPNNEYDVYRNKDGVSKGTIIWVHGGFFIAGSKEGVSNVSTCLAEKGFTVLAINYVLAPEYKYPSQLRQLDDAIKFFTESCSDIDTSRIILAGDSAGGQIVSQYVALVNSRQLQTDLGFTPYVTPDRLAAMALVSAPIDVGMLYGHVKKLDKLLPIFGRAFYGKSKWFNHNKFKSCHTYDYLTDTIPPTFLTDGNNVSFETQNKRLGERLKALNVPVQELFFDKTTDGEVNHEYIFCLSTKAAQNGFNALLNFLNTVTKQ